ncbi:MAG: hypothetical protein ACRDPE_06925 [Solirubrobacterales bacterium]
MTLDFLSPRPSSGTTLRSPMLDAALVAGAAEEMRDGWAVPASFGDSVAESEACLTDVGFADASALGKFEVSGGSARAGGNAAVRLADGWRCPVRPDRELVLCEPAAAARRHADLSAGSARVCDLTASLAALVIAGPLAQETFARFCALDFRESAFPVGGFRPGSVARTPGFVLREAPRRYLMLFGAAYSDYIWGTVTLAVRGLGGRPVGATALPPIEMEAAGA